MRIATREVGIKSSQLLAGSRPGWKHMQPGVAWLHSSFHRLGASPGPRDQIQQQPPAAIQLSLVAVSV